MKIIYNLMIVFVANEIHLGLIDAVSDQLFEWSKK